MAAKLSPLEDFVLFTKRRDNHRPRPFHRFAEAVEQANESVFFRGGVSRPTLLAQQYALGGLPGAAGVISF